MAPSTEQDWTKVGLDGDDLKRHCTCTGWSLQDVLDVLATDGTSAYPLDWCYSGLDPLEVRAAIRGGVSVERARPPSASSSRWPDRTVQRQRSSNPALPARSRSDDA